MFILRKADIRMTIKLIDYLRGGETDIVPALLAALDSLPDGGTLELGGGTYHLFPGKALTKHYYISNNDAGDKPIAIPLIGKHDITIDGGGAELIFHGGILPIVVDGSSDVTVKNLTIDYAAPFFSQAEIISSDRYTTTLRFDGEEFGCTVAPDGRFRFVTHDPVTGETGHSDAESPLSLEFDSTLRDGFIPSPHKPPYFPDSLGKTDHGFLSPMFRRVSLEETDRNTINMYGNLGFEHTPGNYLVMTYSSREFPGIFVTDSKNVTLEGVTLHHTASMGVICQLSENITLRGVRAEPRPGSKRLISVNADATHFVNCRGKIGLENCKFVRMMDDACNIHGIYGICREFVDGTTIRVGFGHPQQRGINFFRRGDELALVNSDTAETVAVRKVISSTLTAPDSLRITVDRPMPVSDGKLVVENRSTAPDVHITGCESGFNRPRGFLLSSAGHIEVENSVFYNMNQGIQLGAELTDWYESGPVMNAYIHDNDFRNSAYAGGAAIVTHDLTSSVPEEFFHGLIVIENNRFTQSAPRILSANYVRELVYRNNTFTEDDTMPHHGQIGDDGLRILNCGRIVTE